MRKLKVNRCILLLFVLLYLGYETSIFGIENYKLKPLFELKAGRGIDEFRLTFAPAPFAPVEGRKTPLCFTGTHALVDNAGNFYLLKERKNIAKIGPEGELIGEIRGVQPFTVPMDMKLDGEDNLYVKFRNDANVVELFRYRVAKFDKQGQLLHWIGDQEGFKCIFLDVHINGSVSVTSCAFKDALKYKDQFQMYDKNGRFIGLFTHQEIIHKDTVDSKGTHIMSIQHILAVGADGNVYVVNAHDLTVKKYINHDGSLTTTEGVEPVAEKELFPWIKIGGKPKFQGFDINNNMYFYFSKWKREELPRFFIDVALFSDTLQCVKYNFDANKYDTLICHSEVKEEGKFITRKLLRNYIGELYEVVIFFNDPPNVTPADHVRFYKWTPIN